MRLVMATADLTVEGRSFAGFPMLLDDDGWPLEPAQSFLWHALITHGSIESKLTWEAYGRRLYDYFAFLSANDLAWNEDQKPHGLSVLARYRNWSLGELGLNPNTVNKRLNLVVRFYDWCKRQGYVSHLPFGMRDVRTPSHQGFLAHVDRTGGVVSKPMVMARERKATIKFLIKEQVRQCLGARMDPSHALLFNLMVRTGMRSCEARTFPLTYVFNPRIRRGLTPGQMIRVNLEPADMHIKYGKPRSVDLFAAPARSAAAKSGADPCCSCSDRAWNGILERRRRRRDESHREKGWLPGEGPHAAAYLWDLYAVGTAQKHCLPG